MPPDEDDVPDVLGGLDGAAAGALAALSPDFFDSVDAGSDEAALVSEAPDSPAGAELFDA